MRVVLAMLAIASLAACADGGDQDSFSGDAQRISAQQAKDRCAADGKRAELRSSRQNLDGSLHYEYACVQ